MATSEDAVLNVAEFSRKDAERFLTLTIERTGEDEKRAILSKYPEVAAQAGDLSRRIGAHIVKRVAGGGDNVMADCLRQRCAAMRGDMGFDDAPAVERLLIDRIIVTWLHLYNVESVRQAEGLSLTKAAYYDRAASMAQADHVRALTALAKVRKLALPSVQVNLTTGNQLNVAG